MGLAVDVYAFGCVAVIGIDAGLTGCHFACFLGLVDLLSCQ
ncbi:hypothetical protein SAMN05216266_12756 [Amycolatopsis marina]|uniref:Uncharacterized protein n=1 Tax=Amycolatopsis marina TaxID=490629 RepID=A0A1I1CF57_9PSEU|nr:hypothetical protein SAMN05216266_12756 [Amycolatopsis marina]